MRYTRMKKKFGTYPGGGTSTSSDSNAVADDTEGSKTTPAKKSPSKKAAAPKSKANKKRKLGEDSEDASEEQDGKVKEELVDTENLEDVFK